MVDEHHTVLHLGGCTAHTSVCLGPFQDAQDVIFKDRSTVDLSGLYDPCFLLHLFSELTRPGNCSLGGGRGRSAVEAAGQPQGSGVTRALRVRFLMVIIT